MPLTFQGHMAALCEALGGQEACGLSPSWPWTQGLASHLCGVSPVKRRHQAGLPREDARVVSTQHTPGARPKLCTPFLLLPCCTKSAGCVPGLLRGTRVGGFRTPLEPPPPTQQPLRAEPCHWICCSEGLSWDNPQTLLKMQISEPSPAGPTPLSFHQTFQ